MNRIATAQDFKPNTLLVNNLTGALVRIVKHTSYDDFLAVSEDAIGQEFYVNRRFALRFDVFSDNAEEYFANFDAIAHAERLVDRLNKHQITEREFSRIYSHDVAGKIDDGVQDVELEYDEHKGYWLSVVYH